MTTVEAFGHLISKRGWYSACKINPATASSFMRHYRAGKISVRKMEALLKAAGWKKKPESWTIA